MKTQTRVGVVDFLNSRPLAWNLLNDRAPAGFEVSCESPAQIADALRQGRLDVGLVPSIEVQRIPDLRVIAGGCVAAQREVRSVLLLSTVAFDRIRRVSLDHNSRTSAALVRILLAERHGCRPEFVSRRPALDEMLEDADAALIIGDPALRVRREGYRVLDLASEWRLLTDLPFVFAVWAARGSLPEARIGELAAVLEASRRNGLAERRRIASEAASELDLDVGELEVYLTTNLSFSLGELERRSLDEFYRRAHQFDLIDEVRAISFIE